MNDKVVAVLEPDSAALSLYSRQTQEIKLCARLQPVCGERADLRRASVAIKENNRSAISIEVAFRSPKDALCRITYELSAGDPFIKVRQLHTQHGGLQRIQPAVDADASVVVPLFLAMHAQHAQTAGMIRIVRNNHSTIAGAAEIL